MIHIQLVYNKGYKWFERENVFVKGYIFTSGNQLLKGEALIDYFSDIDSFSDFQSKIKEANGLFSVVIKNGNSLWASVDHARIFPVFYYHKDDFFEITDNPGLLREHIPMILDENNAMVLCYSGFVPGDKTLLKDVCQLRAGESLCYENNNVTKEFHTQFLTNTFSAKSREELKEELKIVLDNVGKRMVKALGNRPVALPLSGGFDSRILACLLKKNNYPNVLCFTYGLNNNVEVSNARRTAENLGYEWHFTNYANYFDHSLTDDPVFKEYIHFSGTYSNKFYTQEYYATLDLQDLKKVSENTVFIPGHSGAIAGHLLKKKMMEPDFSFVDYALEETFSLVYPRKKDQKLIRKEIDFLNNHDKKYPSFLLYENWRFQETTAKLGLNAAKLWDFLGYEFMLPLWDKELYSFFVQVPLQHKYDKNLYIETLTELFKENNIYFSEKELFVSEKLVRKVSFRSRLKKRFPFLKKLKNIWKTDNVGTQYYTKGFVEELKNTDNKRKVLSVNGIYSAWYVEQVKKEILK